MFSTTIHNNSQKSASSSRSEGKPSTRIGAMRCCDAQTGRKALHRRWRGAGGCIGSGTLLVLLPKCPMCIAAYLAVWMGASVAMPIAMRLRPTLEMVFAVLAVLLAVRLLPWRWVKRITVARGVAEGD